ncbi:Uncharacterised protein [Mycobacterium tuberculosis]|nr:Uncharacterised protein [Mycobacterium tuberculosis]
MLFGCRQPLLRLVGNEVRSDQAESSGRRQIPRECINPIAQHRIPVGHHYRTPAGDTDGLDRG